jgi:hypothetical protein
MPLSITSAREADTAVAAFERDRNTIICGICRFSAAAEAVSSLHEIPIPHEFGSLSEAASDIIEGRWVTRADLKRPATAQEIDDAIRWHTRNRAAEDVHSSWRYKSTKGGYLMTPGITAVDFEYRKGWTIGSTPDRSVWVRGYDSDMSHWKYSTVVVDEHRQFHLCDDSGRPGTGSGRALQENMCETERSGRWLDRRIYSRWSPQAPTLLLGDIARRIVNGQSGFDCKYVNNYLVSGDGFWYPPLPR